MEDPLHKPLTMGQFRLVELLLGNSSEDIICSLSTHQLGQSPNYIALSYVWGDQGITRPIFVEGRPVEIRRSLFSALQALRLERESRIIWADAICINQEDEDERAEQVALMGGIFRLCTDCIIWLGPSNIPAAELIRPADIPEGLLCLLDEYNATSDPDVAAVVGLLTALRELRIHYIPEDEVHCVASYSVCQDDRLKRGYDNEEIKQCLFDYCTEDAIHSLINILRRPWWSRVWILQEALLPRQRRKPVNLLLGPKFIELDTFLLGSDGWDEDCIELLTHTVQDTESSHLHSALIPALILLSSLSHLEKSIRGAPYGRQVLDVYWTHLYSLADRKCSDPRDLIYGLLGLINGPFTLGTPDYSQAVSQCFIQATRHFIANTSSLRHLMLANPLRRLVPDLPSWTLDYSSLTTSTYHWIWRRKSHDEWDTGAHEVYSSSTASAILKVKGVRLTTGKDVLPMSRWECGEHSWFPLVMSWYITASGLGVTNTEFLRTLFHFAPTSVDDEVLLLRDFVDLCDFRNAKSLAYFSEGFFSAADSLLSLEETQAASKAYQARATRRLTTMHQANVALATLEDGRIGLVYETTQPGDTIVILKGIAEPVVLRPKLITAYTDTDNFATKIVSYHFHGICVTSRPLGEAELQRLKWKQLELV